MTRAASNITLEQIHKARDILGAAEIVDDGNMWMFQELSCGHIAAIPLGRNTANHHLVGDDDGKPLYPCCIEALRLKETS